MTRILRILAIAALAAIIMPAPRTVAAADNPRFRPSMLGLWGGVSFNSLDRGLLSSVPNRDFHELAVRLSWELLSSPFAGLEYTFDLIPAAVVTNIPVFAGEVALRDNALYYPPVVGAKTKVGMGAAPIGVRAWAGGALRVYAAATVGFLAFNGEVPIAGGTAFNFTFTLGAGAELRMRHMSVFGGYNLQHLSNGNSGLVNPGIDSHVFYAGLGWLYQ